jgi:invasion protein IalB
MNIIAPPCLKLRPLFLFSALFVLASIFLIPAEGLAASSEKLLQKGTVSSTWDTSCSDLRCVITRSYREKSTTRKVASISVLFDRQDGKTSLLLTVPLGVSLEPGIRFVVGKKRWHLPLKVCIPAGCQAFMDLSDAQVALLRSVDKSDVRMFTQGESGPLSVTIQLDGLANKMDEIFVRN